MIWNILLAIVVLNIAFLIWQNNSRPTLGVQADGRLSPLSKKPNCVSSFEDGERGVDPLPMASTPAATVTAINTALNRLGNVSIIEQDGNYIRAIAKTKLMRYKDDIELLIDADNRQVHYRSSSRAGYSDMGVNKARYEQFAKYYNEAAK